MIRWLIPFMLMSSPLIAETVNVRTGEHADFSRLVFSLDRPSDWTLQQDGAGYILRFARDDIEFNLDRVFYYIPRTRLIEIEISGPASLLLGVADNVHIETLQLDPRTLVLDLRFELPSPNALSEQRFEDNLNSVSNGLGMTRRDEGNIDSHLASYWRNMPPSIGNIGATSIPNPNSIDSTVSPDWSSRRLSEAEAALTREISRATAQGLVEPNTIYPGDLGVERRISRSPTPNISPENENSTIATQNETESRLAVRSRTALDRDTRIANGATPLSAQGEECLADDAFALATWRGSESVIVKLGSLRNALVGEFDDPNAEAVSVLARFLVSLGWGTEALALIRSFDLENELGDTIPLLAKIVEGRDIDAAAPLQEMLSCDGDVALWAALSNSINSDDRINATAVKRAFSALPPDLRRDLGPRLANRMIELEEPDAAHAISTMIARSSIDGRGAAALIEANHHLSANNPHPVPSQLYSVITENRILSIDALVVSVDAALQARLPVSSDILKRIEAAAFDHRGSDKEPLLRRAHILSAGSIGEFSIAFENLREFNHLFGFSQVLEIHEVLARQIFDINRESAFLHIYFTYRPNLETTELSWEIRQMLAERLNDAGFPDEVPRLLKHDGHSRDTGRLLLAKAALLARNGREALRILGDLSGSEADLIRADALALTGNHAAARYHLQDLGNQEEAAFTAWRSADSDTLGNDGTEAHQAVLSLEDPLILGENDAETKGPLETNRALVEASRSLRDGISSILRETE